MNQEIKTKWVETLRSDRYEQGRGCLRRKDETYCCLGVLCDLVAPLQWESVDDTQHYFIYGTDADVPSSIRERAEISHTHTNKLIQLNDIHYKNFNQIADYIEKVL